MQNISARSSMPSLGNLPSSANGQLPMPYNIAIGALLLWVFSLGDWAVAKLFWVFFKLGFWLLGGFLFFNIDIVFG